MEQHSNVTSTRETNSKWKGTITAQGLGELHKQYRERLLNRAAITRNRDAAEDITAAAFSAA